jgi:dTDP-D-glucose 4,6-dehydratase
MLGITIAMGIGGSVCSTTGAIKVLRIGVIYKALRNEKIPVYGRGLNVREWLYVADCAAAVLGAVEKADPGEIYNVGSGEEKRNIDVVKIILQILGKPEELIEFVKDRLGHDFRYSLNSQKIRSELGVINDSAMSKAFLFSSVSIK